MLKVDINLLFTVINLFLLFFVIWKFLFKPVKKIIAKRQEEVNAGYAEAEKAKADAEAAKASYEEQLLKAEKSEILKDSRIRAAKEYDKIIADAKQSATDLVEKAKKDATEESDRIRKKAGEELGDLVSKAAAKIALTKEDPEADLRLYDDFISKSGE